MLIFKFSTAQFFIYVECSVLIVEFFLIFRLYFPHVLLRMQFLDHDTTIR